LREQTFQNVPADVHLDGIVLISRFLNLLLDEHSTPNPDVLRPLGPRLIRHKGASLTTTRGHRPISILKTPTGPVLQVGDNGLAKFGKCDAYFAAPEGVDDSELKINSGAVSTLGKMSEPRLVEGVRVLHPSMKVPSWDGRSNEIPTGICLAPEDTLYIDGKLFAPGNDKTNKDMPNLSKKVWQFGKNPIPPAELVHLAEKTARLIDIDAADPHNSAAKDLLEVTKGLKTLNDDCLFEGAADEETLTHLGKGLPDVDAANLRKNVESMKKNDVLRKTPALDLTLAETSVVWAPAPKKGTNGKVIMPKLHLVTKPQIRNELVHGTLADLEQLVFKPCEGLKNEDLKKAEILANDLNKKRESDANIGLVEVWVPSYLCTGAAAVTLDNDLGKVITLLEKERGNFTATDPIARRALILKPASFLRALEQVKE